MPIKDSFYLQRSDSFYLEPREEVTINLSLTRVPDEPNTIFIGMVTDECCEPIPDATVKVFNLEYVPIEHTITNEHGKFCFNNILSPGKYIVIAVAENFKVSMSCMITIIPNIEIKQTIKLYKNDILYSGTVYGNVIDDTGNVLSNATVTIYCHNEPETIFAITYSNSDGEYLVYGLKKGQYLIKAEKKGYTVPDKVSFIIRQINEFVSLDLLMYAESSMQRGTISGKIKSKGLVVPNAVVALYKIDDEKHTLVQIKEANKEGVYLFSEVSPGEYLVKSKETSYKVKVTENQFNY